MPGRWVGGKGSIASPVKDACIEAEVFSDRGTAQGTILVKVKRIYAPGALGRFFLGDLLSASDKAYREWAGSKTGRLTTVDGSYHLCKGPTEECPAAGQHEVTVHLGKWRTWKEEDLLGGETPEGYGKEAKAMLSQCFKREGLDRSRGDGAKLPWTAPGDLNLKKDKEKKRREEENKERTPKEKETGEKAAKVAKVTALEKELRILKKNLLEEEEEAEKEQPKKKRAAAGSEPRSKKDKKKAGVAFDKGGLRDAEANEMGADWGSSGESSESRGEESDDGASSSSGEESSRASRRAKKKKKKKRNRGRSEKRRPGGRKSCKEEEEEKEGQKVKGEEGPHRSRQRAFRSRRDQVPPTGWE
jgi:hypothetical protein